MITQIACDVKAKNPHAIPDIKQLMMSRNRNRFKSMDEISPLKSKKNSLTKNSVLTIEKASSKALQRHIAEITAEKS
jgi:hypothetical protein